MPREFREAAKKYYHTLHEQYKDYEGLHFQNAKAKVQERMVTLNYFFGLHNLSSDAEGEELLTVPRKKVQRIYAGFKEREAERDTDNCGLTVSDLANVRAFDMFILFGDKCLR